MAFAYDNLERITAELVEEREEAARLAEELKSEGR
jgi:hypothetical protein